MGRVSAGLWTQTLMLLLMPYSHPFITCFSSNLEIIYLGRDPPVSVSPELRLYAGLVLSKD